MIGGKPKFYNEVTTFLYKVSQKKYVCREQKMGKFNRLLEKSTIQEVGITMVPKVKCFQVNRTQVDQTKARKLKNISFRLLGSAELLLFNH